MYCVCFCLDVTTGTTDGPGAFNFTQGDAGTGTPFWNEIRDLIATPSQEQVCMEEGILSPITENGLAVVRAPVHAAWVAAIGSWILMTTLVHFGSLCSGCVTDRLPSAKAHSAAHR